MFDRDGVPFNGRYSADEKGRAFYTRQRVCGRCGGAGGADKWAHTGWTCFECSGSGKGGIETVKLYSREQLDKLNATQAKRRAKLIKAHEELAEAKRALADTKRADFDTVHGELLKRAEEYADRSDFIADVSGKARERCELSDKAADALRAAIERIATADRAKAASVHVGKIGERFVTTVTVEFVGSYDRPKFGYDGRRETVWIITMRDANSCAIVSKSPSFHFERGTRLTIAATVKEHTEFRGQQQTIVQRVTVKERIEA